MRAAVLKAFGAALSVESVPDPIIGTGEVLVDVAAAPVLPYAREVFSGARQYVLPIPVIPGTGAVGRVRAIGPDATHLAVGDWVMCDPTVRSRDDAFDPDITLQGLSARGEGGMRLQQYYRDGSFAEQVRVPTENAIRLGTIEAADATRWCPLNTLLVPYGGLLAVEVQAGETVAISGSTGHFGSAAVAVALAMGARCVVAPGRNEKMLAELTRRFGNRVQTVNLTSVEAEDTKRIREAAGNPIDCVLDILPPSASAAAARAVLMAVRPHGRVALMGGVGMLGGPGLELPYPWIMRNWITVRGQWMYSPNAVPRMINLVRAGLIDLHQFEVATFALDRANDAVAHAAANSGPFKMTVIVP